MTTSLEVASPLQPPAGTPQSLACGPVVIDTNVALDLLLFKDPRVQHLHQALIAQRLRWIATERMLDELGHVLRRSALAHWAHDCDQVMREARGLCQAVSIGAEAASQVPRCTDPDDQMFIDLAWHWPTPLLFSRDRALLRLGRPARLRGLWIGTPERWGASPSLTQQEQRRPKPPL